MSELSEINEVRDLVRKAILDVLKEERHGAASFTRESTVYEQRVPAPHEVTLVLRGSERAVGLLEAALADGEKQLEIAIGERFGPKARVTGRIG